MDKERFFSHLRMHYYSTRLLEGMRYLCTVLFSSNNINLVSMNYLLKDLLDAHDLALMVILYSPGLKPRTDARKIIGAFGMREHL